MAPLILFRADGGPGIGAGHVMRCLALAQELRRQGAACRLATCRPEAAAAWSAAGFEVFSLPGAIAGPEDLAATAALARQSAACWLICDSYALSAPEHAALHPSGSRLACWDDLADRPLSCELVINHNAGAEQLSYPCPALLGPRYATLRTEILELRGPRGRGILIAFGAAEPAELGMAAAAAILAACPEVPVHLVCPPVSTAGLPARLTVYPVGPALAPLMVAADVVLCAGGVTLLELAFLGTPMVVLPLADNQLPGSRAMAAAGAAALVEDTNAAAAAVARLLADDAARRTMAVAGQSLVDGRGAQRVARRLLEDS